MRATVSYTELLIRLYQGRGEDILAQAMSSDPSRMHESLPIVLGREEIAAALAAAQHSFEDECGLSETPGSLFLDLGDTLFRALFKGSLRETFIIALDRAENHARSGVRIRLLFDLTSPQIQPLAALPWEVLYRKETRDFLSRNIRTPIARYLEVPRALTPIRLRGPLRILVAIATPIDQLSLETAKELSYIESLRQGQMPIEILVLEHATPSALRHHLRSAAFNILHFIGHGSYNMDSGEGFLAFERPNGRSEQVSGAVLSEILKGCQGLRLVVLNTCSTARSTFSGGDAFGGVAASLILAGLPAVIAMKYSMTDSACLTFSRALYSALAEGDAIDTAVTEARLEMFTESPGSWEWVTPSLYIGSLNERLFRPLRPHASHMENAGEASPKGWPIVFLAHAKQDEAAVRVIASLLRKAGYEPWIDAERILPGQNRELQINKAIRESSFFIACLSRNSVGRAGNLHRELKLGLKVFDEQPEGRIYLIPVLIDDCQLPVRFEELSSVRMRFPQWEGSLLKALSLGTRQRAEEEI